MIAPARHARRVFARAAIALVAPVAIAALAACSPAKREAASLVFAVDAFRRAENADKITRAKLIEDAKCTDHEVCDARAACLSASEPTAKGLALKAEVEAALAQLHAGQLTQEEAAARGLPDKLDEASRLLDEGHGRLPACDAKVTALRLKFGL